MPGIGGQTQVRISGFRVRGGDSTVVVILKVGLPDFLTRESDATQQTPAKAAHALLGGD